MAFRSHAINNVRFVKSPSLTEEESERSIPSVLKHFLTKDGSDPEDDGVVGDEGASHSSIGCS